MAYTENKSIDWLIAITPTTDDLVVTMDQAEVWVAKSSTLASIYNLFKTTYDTLYAKYLGDADFYKYSIVRSVWNLIANNSFETDLSWYTTYWLLTISRVTSEFYNWVASMQIVASNNVSWAYVWYSFVAGKIYTMSFYAKWTSWKQILSYTDAGWVLTSTLNWWWQRFEYTFIASFSGLVWINFRSQEVSWDTFYIDAVQLEEWTLTAWPFTTTQWNLTVALKNYEGNDPTPTKPVKIQIGGVIRTITSSFSFSLNNWTNWFNSGSSELATKEIDYFCYIRYSPGGLSFITSRYPNANIVSDFSASGTYTNEKYACDSDGTMYLTTDPVVNIGRFNATLSAGGAYTWSIPATSVIINRPILENQKQKNQLIVGEWINQSASYTTSVTMDFSSFIEYDITAQAWALLFNNPSGTPVNWQKRMVRIKDNWTARALTYWTQFASWSGTLLPTTVISKKSWMGFEWDSTDSKYYCIASCTQP